MPSINVSIGDLLDTLRSALPSDGDYIDSEGFWVENVNVIGPRGSKNKKIIVRKATKTEVEAHQALCTLRRYFWRIEHGA